MKGKDKIYRNKGLKRKHKHETILFTFRFRFNYISYCFLTEKLQENVRTFNT
jgi:hypothetical protein